MKIAVIFTGGTIGSAEDEKFIRISRESGDALIELYRQKYRSEIGFESFTPYFIHSENLTFNKLYVLTECVSRVLSKNYDGIIITHGTDTLQFTAAALGLIFAGCKIPVLLVSANRPLGDSRSNGMKNFAAAVEFIVRGIANGVFVSYKNEGSLSEIHSATRLMDYNEFSDILRSAMGVNYGCFANSCFIKNPNYSYRAYVRNSAEKLSADFSASGNVSVIKPYLGLVYPEITENIRAVIHTSYHSGTVCTESEAFKSFADECKEKGVAVFLTGMLENTKQYESTGKLEKLGIVPLPNITFASAYIKLILLLSDGNGNIAERMLTPVCDEFFK